MKVPFASLLLLLTALLCQGTYGNERYRKFINQHIKADMRDSQCDSVIRQRKISETDSNLCKPTNTFIRATAGRVTPICGAAGVPDGHLRRSIQPFDLVICKLKNNGARQPHCQHSFRKSTSRIKISCEGGLPVHFGGDIVVVNK